MTMKNYHKEKGSEKNTDNSALFMLLSAIFFHNANNKFTQEVHHNDFLESYKD